MWSGVNNFHSDLWLYDFPPWEALKKGQRRISLSQLHEVRSIFLWWNLWLVGPLGKKGSFWMLVALYFHLKKEIWCVWHFAFFVRIILKGIFNCNTSHILSNVASKKGVRGLSDFEPSYLLFLGWSSCPRFFPGRHFGHQKLSLGFSSIRRGKPGLPKRCRGMSCWQMWLPAKDLRLRAPRCRVGWWWWRWGA